MIREAKALLLGVGALVLCGVVMNTFLSPLVPIVNKAQQATVAILKAQGFEQIIESKEIVRMTRGADRRVIFQDGTQKRGYHVDMRRTKQ